MKIVFIGQKGMPSEFGGIETHAEKLATQLVELGFDVSAYTRPWFTDKNKTEYKGVKLISIPTIKTKHLDAILHTFLASIHASFSKQDIIHYHGVGPALLAWVPKVLFSKAKVVVTFHCIDRLHQKWGRFAQFMLKLGESAANKFADKTIAVSQGLKKYCKDEYNNEAVYIPNGINLPQTSEPEIIKNEFGLEKNEYILMVSRLVRHKGAQYLIKAYNELNTDKKLVIVGGSSFTDDYVKELHELAKDNPNIIFTGFQSGKILDELFTNAYIFVHPSEAEGLPICVLEALSYGKCGLVSDIPENIEAISEFGYSFKNKDYKDLAELIKYLLDKPALVTKIGKQSQKYVLENYNWKDIVKNTGNLYKSLKYTSKKELKGKVYQTSTSRN